MGRPDTANTAQDGRWTPAGRTTGGRLDLVDASRFAPVALDPDLALQVVVLRERCDLLGEVSHERLDIDLLESGPVGVGHEPVKLFAGHHSSSFCVWTIVGWSRS